MPELLLKNIFIIFGTTVLWFYKSGLLLEIYAYMKTMKYKYPKYYRNLLNPKIHILVLFTTNSYIIIGTFTRTLLGLYIFTFKVPIMILF